MKHDWRSVRTAEDPGERWLCLRCGIEAHASKIGMAPPDGPCIRFVGDVPAVRRSTFAMSAQHAASSRPPVVIATAGANSDYHVVAILEWLTEKTPAACKDEFLEAFPTARERYEFDGYQFVGWLVRQGYAQDLPAIEMHTDDYGDADGFSCRDFEQNLLWRRDPTAQR